MRDVEDLRPAPSGRRIGGRVVDLVVAGWLLAFAAIEIDGRLLGGDVLARQPLSAVTPEGTRLAVIAAVVIAATEVVPTAYWGRTPGKVMLGLRCIDIHTGRPPGLIRSVFRGLLLHAWVGIPVVGWVLPAAITVTTVVASRGRGLHDRMAGTMVVDVASDDDPAPADLAPDDPRLDPQ
jgi:uncharacterized RDD family membrane protein YckC